MRPTPRYLLLATAALAVAALPLLFGERLWTLWVAYVGLLVVVLGMDALLALPARRLRVRVEAPGRIAIGERGAARVELSSRAWLRSTRVRILGEVNPLLVPPGETELVVPAGHSAHWDLPLAPVRRGTARLERLWLRWTGPFGLMALQRRVPVEREVPIVTNVSAARTAALRFFGTRARAVGLKVERYVGDGTEFDSMREYVPGLDSRSINWKTTARHRKLVCQEFRVERNHQIILAIDTGYLMSEPIGGVPKLDHAVTAALGLCYVSLRTGDRVGIFGFDARGRAYAEPQGGAASFPRLQQVCASLEYSTQETNFTLGLAELSGRLRRRSLIVLLTDFVDTVTAELMVENLQRLVRRHLVVFVTLRDPQLDETVNAAPATLGALYRSVVATEFVRERDIVLARLRRLGIQCIDRPPGQIGTRLLNTYLDAKRRELV